MTENDDLIDDEDRRAPIEVLAPASLQQQGRTLLEGLAEAGIALEPLDLEDVAIGTATAAEIRWFE